MSEFTVCPECKNRIFHSGGHNTHCPIRRQQEAFTERYKNGGIKTDPFSSLDADGFEDYQITGGLTESEFFGGDIGDK